MGYRDDMYLLAVIANHGTGNRQYLDRLLAAYREMPLKTHLVILSNIAKDLGPDVEVRVGVPSENPWSLPFAHRPLFRERLEDHEFFIYSEDDTLLEWPVLERFIQSIDELEPNEIAGFMRTETGPDGRVYYSTSHSFFRWLPDTVRERSGKLWARYSNEHAACFVASRDQVKRAFESGGFGDEPHEGRHDMLCAAATDIYTRCGIERLVCLDDLDRFLLPHLPNKYVGRMGLPREEMDWQIEALRKVHEGVLSRASLFDPETKLPRGRGSKLCREQPDEVIAKRLGERPSRVLVWGSGDGVAEAELAARRHEVTVMPLDAVLGHCCEKRGLAVLPPEREVLRSLEDRFDRVIVRDGLHLLEQPERLLGELRPLLRAGGLLILRVPNFNEAGFQRKRWRDARYQLPWTREHIGATPFTVRSLKRLCEGAGYSHTRVWGEGVSDTRVPLNRATLGAFQAYLSRFLYAVAEAER